MIAWQTSLLRTLCVSSDGKLSWFASHFSCLDNGALFIDCKPCPYDFRCPYTIAKLLVMFLLMSSGDKPGQAINLLFSNALIKVDGTGYMHVAFRCWASWNLGCFFTNNDIAFRNFLDVLIYCLIEFIIIDYCVHLLWLALRLFFYKFYLVFRYESFLFFFSWEMQHLMGVRNFLE